MAKSYGDNMHMGNKHPFANKWTNHTGVGKASMTGIEKNPGGGGNKISAASNVKFKRNLNGPGNA